MWTPDRVWGSRTLNCDPVRALGELAEPFLWKYLLEGRLFERIVLVKLRGAG